MFVKYLARYRCEHCNHPRFAEGRFVLSVYPLNRLIHDCRYANLIALCNKCRPYVQSTYRTDHVWSFDDFTPTWAKVRGILSNPSFPAP